MRAYCLSFMRPIIILSWKSLTPEEERSCLWVYAYADHEHVEDFMMGSHPFGTLHIHTRFLALIYVDFYFSWFVAILFNTGDIFCYYYVCCFSYCFYIVLCDLSWNFGHQSCKTCCSRFSSMALVQIGVTYICSDFEKVPSLLLVWFAPLDWKDIWDMFYLHIDHIYVI